MIRGLTAVGGLHNLSMCKRMKLMIYDTRYSSPWEDFRKKIGACGRMALVRPPMPGGLERTKGVLEASHGARAWLPLLLFTTAPPRSIASPRLAAQQSSPWEPSSQAVSALGPRKPSRTRRGGGGRLFTSSTRVVPRVLGARPHVETSCRETLIEGLPAVRVTAETCASSPRHLVSSEGS